MSSLSTQGARPLAPPVLPASGQVAGRAPGVQTTSASGNTAARLPTVDPVALQDDVVSISRRGLQARIGELGNSTVDLAQKLLTTFARRLFGDAAKGASIDFGAVSLDTEANFGAAAGTEGANRAAAFSYQESADFIGTGQIITEDGQTFDFEIEIKYEASVEASAVETSAPPKGGGVTAPDVLALTGKPLPAIKFPGSLNDLFKLLGRELRSGVSGNDSGENGNLTLRLLRLVDRAALLAPRAAPDDPQATPTERAKAAAQAYASAPALSELAQA